MSLSDDNDSDNDNFNSFGAGSDRDDGELLEMLGSKTGINFPEKSG